MVNVRRNINARTSADFHRRSIIDHLFAFSGDDVNNFFRAGMIVSCVTFSLCQINQAKTEALCSSHGRLAQKMNFAPVKFQRIDIVSGRDNARARSLHRGRNFSLFI